MKIAVTGGIGAGKSEVMKEIARRGYRVCSADEINDRLQERPGYIQKISKVFPAAVKDGKIDKNVLRDIVFTDDSKRARLNAIAHPEIRRELENTEGDFFAEVPLLFESGMQDLFDAVIIVTANADTRIDRIKGRGLSEERAKSIMAAQFSDSDRIRLSDNPFIIENDGNIENLIKQTDEILKKIQGEKYGNNG